MKQPPRRRRFSFLRFFVLLFLLGGAFGAGLAAWGYKQFEKDLPDRWTALTDYSPSKASRVYAADGELIGEFFLQKRLVVPYSHIPRHVRLAFVAAEDNRFFEHSGVDPVGILRAAFANLKAGHVVQGGSTITQQVAKLMLVGNERNMFRKIREAILANKIERRLSKEQILSIYLNHLYLGHGAYGVQAASEVYFGKDVSELTVAEAAILAGLPKAPTEDSPFTNFRRSKERQLYVLKQMVDNGFLSPDDAALAREEPVAIISHDTPLNHVAAPYFVEYVRKYVESKYGDTRLYDKGLRIYTTLDMRQQRAAETAVRRGLEDLDLRLGFRGPIGHVEDSERQAWLDKGPVPYAGAHEDVAGSEGGGAILPDKPYVGLLNPLEKGHGGKAEISVHIGPEKLSLTDEDADRIARWAARRKNQLRPGDLVPVKVVSHDVRRRRGNNHYIETLRLAALAQRPDVQAALVAVEPSTGRLTAMVGGYDYDLSKFNRVVQMHRQAGSSVKPYIYAAAMEHGYTELSIVQDAPISVRTATGVWTPHNYRDEYMGPVTLRTALAESLNTVSVRLVESIGLDNVIGTFRRFGITSPIVRHPSIALGVPELSPMEAAYAQATFASGGYEVKPVTIARILDADGKVLEQNLPLPPAPGQPAATPAPRKRRIPADVAYIVTDMMKNVVQNGTGKGALALGRPVAGKTGTSNDCKDAWFVGFTPDLLAVVWVGRDDYKPIARNATGGLTALPIWLEFMQHGHPDTPVRDFTPPSDILFARATAKGDPAPAGTPRSALIPFRRGTLPPQFSQSSATSTFTDQVF